MQKGWRFRPNDALKKDPGMFGWFFNKVEIYEICVDCMKDIVFSFILVINIVGRAPFYWQCV